MLKHIIKAGFHTAALSAIAKAHAFFCRRMRIMTNFPLTERFLFCQQKNIMILRWHRMSEKQLYGNQFELERKKAQELFTL